MGIQKYTFPAIYQEKIEHALNELNTSLANSRLIADCILKLSSHYQETTSITPWQSREFQIAYLAYFFPLNYIRNLKLYTEALHLNFPNTYKHFIDFGCGLGSSFLAAKDSGFLSDESPLSCIDSYSWPLQILKKYFYTGTFSQDLPQNKNQAFGVFSYSLNELEKPPPWIFDLQHILIVEPSSGLHARSLMALRQTLVDKGFSLWAPCTHNGPCPLLVHSQKDWCHDRIHWEQPEWFSQIEHHLPIKNNTLTTSYLLASKQPTSHSVFGRIIGDELIEKGKTRWMFCRSEQREFLSWLSRYGEAPDWKRGHILHAPPSFELKGNELRLKSES